jgi:hypothetical protein
MVSSSLGLGWPLASAVMLLLVLVQPWHQALAAAVPTTAECRRFVSASLLVSRAIPASWTVTNEKEELVDSGATHHMSRFRYDMNLAFTPLECSANGATMLLSVNSILCTNSGEDFCSMSRSSLTALTRVGLLYTIKPDGSVPRQSRILTLLEEPSGLTAAQPSLATTADTRVLPPSCKEGSVCFDRIYRLLASIAGQFEVR